MVHAIRFEKPGGPEVLAWQEVEVGKPGPGQVRLRHTAVGLNFIDTYQRSGLYPCRCRAGSAARRPGSSRRSGRASPISNPATASPMPAARSAPMPRRGSFPADRLVPVPDGINDQQAAAMMLKGMTAWYLIRRTHPVKPGETILIHAAAGGVGLIVCQWAKHLGATVIGTVGSDEKAALAKEHGCDHPIVYRREDFVARVNRDHRRQEAAGGL